MLDAFIKKSVRRILLTRTAEHQNNKNEDAITSMVFTPLRFMSASDALTCLRATLPAFSMTVAGRTIASLDIELWPQLVAGDKRVEPDLQVVLRFADRSSLVVIGEMKWESSLTAEQIHWERASVGVADRYIFAILKRRAVATAQALGCDEVRTWKEVHRSVRELDTSHSASSSVKTWAALVSQFLYIAEQLVFGGFDEISTNGVPSADAGAVFFVRNGVNKQFSFPPEVAVPNEGSVFYDGGRVA